jgi:hypothetical protein
MSPRAAAAAAAYGAAFTAEYARYIGANVPIAIVPIEPDVPTEEEWVLCDACRKWRRLPPSVRAASLGERWTCEQGRWGFHDTLTAAFTPLSCTLEEPTSSGDSVVPPEEGAPDVALHEGDSWMFAYETADAACRAQQPRQPG